MKRVIPTLLILSLFAVMSSCRNYEYAMSETERKEFFGKYPQPILGPLKATATKVTMKRNTTINEIVGSLEKDSTYYIPNYLIDNISDNERSELFGVNIHEVVLPPSTDIRLNAVVPAFKIFETDKNGRELDGRVLTAIGSGLQIERFVSRRERGEPNSPYRRVSTFSYSPLTVLLSGNGEEFLDVSLAQTVGLLNNTIQFGGGYDFGEVDANRKGRWFFLLSVGVNLNGK